MRKLLSLVGVIAALSIVGVAAADEFGGTPSSR